MKALSLYFILIFKQNYESHNKKNYHHKNLRNINNKITKKLKVKEWSLARANSLFYEMYAYDDDTCTYVFCISFYEIYENGYEMSSYNLQKYQIIA
jgi:hypothetical protein